MKYLPHDGQIYNTNFDDEILSVDWVDSDLESDDLKNYHEKVEYYLSSVQKQNMKSSLAQSHWANLSARSSEGI